MGKLLDNLRKKHAGKQDQAKRHGLSFLAHKDEIVEALREGWTSKQIWEQMAEDGMTAMSYSTFCRHVRATFTSRMDDAAGETVSAIPSQPSSASIKKSSPASSTKRSKQPAVPTEQDQFDALKDEAFAAVRSRKPSGPLIDKPKSREEERRELFGE